MSDKLLEEMMPEEFEAMLEAFTNREEEEVEMSTFFQVWAQIEAERQASAEEIHLTGEIVGNRLVFGMPEGKPTDLQVRGNEIILEDGRRIVLELKSEDLAPA